MQKAKLHLCYRETWMVLLKAGFERLILAVAMKEEIDCGIWMLLLCR